jgi:pimeloyl-ACP methyl ester carboxylesterase
MMADDPAGLLGKIGINSAHIYGESMGGMVAQEFAINYPERVKSLILISTYCGGPHGTLPSPSKRFDRELRAKMSPEELGVETLRLCVTQDYIDNHPDIAKTMMEAMVKMSEPAYAALRQAEAARGFETYERLQEIKAPTLIMAGDADAAIMVENSSIIASMIPHAELVIFKDAGHILIEAGEEPDRIRLDFLRRHSATKA